MAIGNQFGGINACFAEVTFTGSGYSIGTLYTRFTTFFQALASPPLTPDSTLQLSIPYTVPLTNFAIFGLRDRNLGFRVSKNGNNIPFFDVYNSLFCAPTSIALHANLGSFIFGVQKASPTKAMLFDYTITGAGPA